MRVLLCSKSSYFHLPLLITYSLLPLQALSFCMFYGSTFFSPVTVKQRCFVLMQKSYSNFGRSAYGNGVHLLLSSTTSCALSSFPETVPRTLVQEAQGVCVEHASQQGPRPRPPKLFCGEDGQWVGQPTTSCACLPGFEPADGHARCTGKREAR